MKKINLKLEGKQIGIFTALIIAAIMLILPSQDRSKYHFNPDLIAKTIKSSDDHVSPQTLSEWIIEGKNDYQLIDIRSPKEYEKGNIKTSSNIPLEKLLKKKTIENEIKSDKLIILYSNGNSHAHQAWIVLKTAGLDTYVLEGGYNYWNEAILNPKLPKTISSDDEVLRYAAAQSVAQYFGGTSQDAVSDSSKSSAPKKKVIKKKKKKKLEGC